MSRIDESRPFIPVGIAVLTVSDTRSLADDKSGDTLVGRIEEAGHRLVARAIVKDNKAAIRDQVEAWTKDPEIDVVIETRNASHAEEIIAALEGAGFDTRRLSSRSDDVPN